MCAKANNHGHSSAFAIATSPAKNSLLFYEALLAHNVPAELHLYEVGGHGFGMFQQDRPADKWPELFLAWLKARKLALPLAGGR